MLTIYTATKQYLCVEKWQLSSRNFSYHSVTWSYSPVALSFLTMCIVCQETQKTNSVFIVHSFAWEYAFVSVLWVCVWASISATLSNILVTSRHVSLIWGKHKMWLAWNFSVGAIPVAQHESGIKTMRRVCCVLGEDRQNLEDLADPGTTKGHNH